MFLPTRFFLVCSVISLPVIYGTMFEDLDKYLFNEKEKENTQQKNFLYSLVMMNLYACLDKNECLTYFQDPKNLKKDFKKINYGPRLDKQF